MARRPKRADLGTEFTAEVYRAAAEQHWTSLQLLYDQEHYALSLYISGVAVECMFRAYRARIDSEFDARHDLFAMARAAKFAGIVSSQQCSRTQQRSARLQYDGQTTIATDPTRLLESG